MEKLGDCPLQASPLGQNFRSPVVGPADRPIGFLRESFEITAVCRMY